MKNNPVFETFIPITPVAKSYRQYGRRVLLTDNCRDYQQECIRFLEKLKTETLDGPLWAEYTFFIKRPEHRKNARFPDTKPDHDNLVKSMQDCLERAGIIENDSRIVQCTTRKVFCSGEGSNGVIQVGTKVRLGVL
jgi:Holliday junction resolvase RusA-like endonuclease